MNKWTHFYLYAKSWYAHTDTMDDLMVIAAHYTGMKKSNVSIGNLYGILTEIAWFEINQSGNPENAFRVFCSRTFLGLIEAVIYLMAVAPGDDSNGRSPLGRPDPNILPLDETHAECVDEFVWAS